jgi:AcrR family transcriptional regulator
VADRAILAAALELFIEHGIDGTSIEQIAEVASVARTTVYRRWTSKEALIAQAIAEARGLPEQEAIATRLPLDRLGHQLADALIETVTEPNYRKIVARLIGSLPTCPELMAVYWEKYVLPRRQIVRELLDQARDAGLLHGDTDAETLLDLIGGAIMYDLLVRPGKRTRAEMRAYLLKVLRKIGLSEKAKRATPRRKQRRKS